MNALIVITLGLVAVTATVVVLTTRPQRQAVSLAVFGAVLVPAFLVLGAPDVALSQVAVGTAVVPLMVLLTVRAVERRRRS
ncbi:Na(+)/H(+) antiporter subunit B [Nocardia sp. CA-119907]|uniref:Na(+)/H(+) antiporter subunit B n=1 Tax=unclassified Nocardia TaxID=2637762 RepID=UPI003D980ED2